MAGQCDPCECPNVYANHSLSWRHATLALLCRLINGTGLSDAVFAPLVRIAYSAIDASDYVAAANAALPAETRRVIVENQTNGTVVVSFDGINDFTELRGGGKLDVNLIALSRVFTGTVYVKAGPATEIPTLGNVLVSAIS